MSDSTKKTTAINRLTALDLVRRGLAVVADGLATIGERMPGVSSITVSAAGASVTITPKPPPAPPPSTCPTCGAPRPS